MGDHTYFTKKNTWFVLETENVSKSWVFHEDSDTWLDNCACGNAQLNVYVYKPHLMYETLRTTLGHGKEGCILDDWEEIQCHVVV